MTSFDDIAVLTSENVRLTYTLTGIGSRAIAFIVDSLIIGLVTFLITWLFVISGLAVNDLFNNPEAITMSMGLYIAAITFLNWGYYFFFEWMNWGQTPGKILLGIRVSMVDGAPVDLVACAVRNVVRIVDLGLAILGVTFFVMIFTPKYQRLGDLAAGTVVVRRRRMKFDDVLNASKESDRAHEFAVKERPETAKISIRLTESEMDLLKRFIERRDSLPPHVRQKLASELAERIRNTSPGVNKQDMSDEQLIDAAATMK